MPQAERPSLPCRSPYENEIYDEGQFLYHYVKFERAVGSVLGDGTIRMGPLASTNDPRETEDWRLQTSVSDPGEADDAWAALRDFGKEARRGAVVACFVQDRTRPMSASPGEHNLWRGFARSRMWHHYADEHRGVCIVLDKAALLASAEVAAPGLCCEAVEYTDDQVKLEAQSMEWDTYKLHGRELAIQRFADRYEHELFFTKNRDWEAEREFRLLNRHDPSGPVLIDITSSVVGAVVGPAANGQDFEVVRERLTGFPHASRPARLRWQNGMPYLDPS